MKAGYKKTNKKENVQANEKDFREYIEDNLIDVYGSPRFDKFSIRNINKTIISFVYENDRDNYTEEDFKYDIEILANRFSMTPKKIRFIYKIALKIWTSRLFIFVN